jgi:hypothetical protein
MEKRAPGSVSPGIARQQLDAARRARAGSARRASNPAGLVLSVSFFCGAMTLAPGRPPLASGVTILAVVWLVAELLIMSARNGWRALRSMPRPRRSLLESTLVIGAMLLGGVIGPHLLASRANSSWVSWSLAAGVAIRVAFLRFGADALYRKRPV